MELSGTLLHLLIIFRISLTSYYGVGEWISLGLDSSVTRCDR